MTLPIERARSLRWGWEFLWELRSAGNLTATQHRTVENILAHYPTSLEISAWAQSGPAQARPILGTVTWLAPEPPDQDPLGGTSRAPNTLDRSHVTPIQRMQALFTASEFMHGDLRVAPNLTAAQHRVRISVCRHFPLEVELEAIARSEGLEAEIGQCKDNFILRGMAAMDRTVAIGDGVPAEAAIQGRGGSRSRRKPCL